MILFPAMLLSLSMAEIDQSAWPRAGTSYQRAKASLASSGFRPERRKVSNPHSLYPEIDCKHSARICSSSFVSRAEGWTCRIDVVVDRQTLLLKSDVLWETKKPCDPPKEASNVPHLRGRYLAARTKLQLLGYRPIPVSLPASICSDQSCKRTIRLIEGECATDVPACNFYWRSPKGRYLRVRTEGEFAPIIRFNEWIGKGELPD